MNTRQTFDLDSHFDGWISSSVVQRAIASALKGADDGELYLQHSLDEHYQLSEGRIKVAQQSSGRGFGLRAVFGQTVGFGHSSEFSEAALGRAAAAARSANVGKNGTWNVGPLATEQHIYSRVDPRGSLDAELMASTLGAIDEYVRAQDNRVRQVVVDMQSNSSVVAILRPDAESYHDIRPQVQLYISVVMADQYRMEVGMSAKGGRHDLSILLDENIWRERADEALRIAGVNMRLVAAPAGESTVVLDAGWPGVMVHEAVGHGLEGDAVAKGNSVYAGSVGEKVAAPEVTIVDAGNISECRGSLMFDDEGTPTQENVLIENGILRGFMHDRLSAREMGHLPTGNGRRESYKHTVMPRMTNTYMKSGSCEHQEIIASLKDGIYAANLGGGQVNTITGDFVFECTEAYKVRNGKIEEPIKGATLIGNGPEAMKNVTMVGNNSQLNTGGGSCGKDGQDIPVCVGQPTVRVENMTIGGMG